MQTNGGAALIKSLEMEGVDVIFGLPGGAILPVYDPIIDSPIRHILVRHEQGAGHMAEGYAHATGRPGVAMVTSGPAATNIVTPLADAYMDSVPLVVITGQVGTKAIGTDAFQEVDTTGITRSVTKHNLLVTRADDIPRVIREAFHIATTGRPGPVLVDIPKDIVDPTNPNSALDWYWPDSVDLPGYNPRLEGDPALIEAAAELIGQAQRPVLYAGGGILKARGAEALHGAGRAARHPRRHHAHGPRRLPRRPPAVPRHARHARQLHRGHRHAGVRPAHRAGLAASTTGSPASSTGSPPTPRSSTSTSTPPSWARSAVPTSASPATARLVIEELVTALRELGAPADQPDRSEWRSTISGWQERHPLAYEQSEPGELLKPQYVLEQLRDNTPRRHHRGLGRRPAPDVDSASTGSSTTPTPG